VTAPAKYHGVLTVEYPNTDGERRLTTISMDVIPGQGQTRKDVYHDVLVLLCLKADVPVEQTRTVFWSLEPNQLNGGAQ
jgi:hypothetical protein